MNALYGTYDVFYEGAAVGSLEVSEKGLMVCFVCRCRKLETDIFRLICLSEGKPVSIGILSPEEAALTLKKQFSKNTLFQMGLTEIETCYLLPSSLEISGPDHTERTGTKAGGKQEGRNFCAAWEPEEYPELLFHDEDLSQIASGIQSALKLTYEGITFLAVPVSPYEPFPAMPIFCFGESLTIAGKDYIVFKIKNGKLC